MEQSNLVERREGPVLQLLLNRPKTRNALDADLVDALGAALTRGAQDAAVRVIVLGGQGGAFCSGVDLKSAAADLDHPARLERRLEGFHHLIRTITAAPKPVIAAVDGAAVGFGADLAFACDLRLATTTAYFEEKFVGIGLMPDGGGTFHLPRLVGLSRALELLLLGTRVEASTALAYGLVSKVVPAEDLAEEVATLAARLAAGPPLALAAIKAAVREGVSGTLEDALGREFRGQLRLLGSQDFREGVAAFLERRSPVFRGR